MLKLGSHVSCSSPDFVLGAVKEALSYKATALMLYTGAPQNSFRVPVERLKSQEALDLWQANGFSSDDIVVHAPYIINLANTIKPETYANSVSALKKEIQRTIAIKAKYLVVHPGSYLTATLQEGIDSIAKGINEALNENDDVIICLETMAGKGKEVGWRFEQIKAIIDKVELKDKMGVCFDTCHTWDSGYDLNDLDNVLKQFDEIIGLDKMYVIHVNDSKNVLGAKKDRHENIGKGNIGFEVLHKVVNHPLLEDKIKILETPYVDDKPIYGQEIEMLRG